MDRKECLLPDFQFVRLRLGAFEFGIDVKCVREMIMNPGLMRVQGAPSFIEGFLHLRGIYVPVIDLRKRFALGAEDSGSVGVVIVAIDGRIIGLLVDEMNDVATGCSEARLKTGQTGSGSSRPWDGCTKTVVEMEGKSINIIDLGRLLSAVETASLDGPLLVE